MRSWTRSNTQCRHRRAVGEGAVAARELGGGSHGGSALVRARGTKSERERKGRAEEVRARCPGAPLL